MRHTAIRPLFVIGALAIALAAGAAATLRERRSAAAQATLATPVPARVLRPVSPPPRLDALAPSHSVKDVMVGVVDPAADGIWNSLGSVVTVARDETWAPSTDEDWRRLEGHARALARGAAALAEPARVNGREGWTGPAHDLQVASGVALAAAQRHDVPGLAAASEGLLNACQQCHKRYWLPTETTP